MIIWSAKYNIIVHIEYCLTSYLHMSSTDNCKALLMANVCPCLCWLCVSESFHL